MICFCFENGGIVLKCCTPQRYKKQKCSLVFTFLNLFYFLSLYSGSDNLHLHDRTVSLGSSYLRVWLELLLCKHGGKKLLANSQQGVFYLNEIAERNHQFNKLCWTKSLNSVFNKCKRILMGASTLVKQSM